MPFKCVVPGCRSNYYHVKGTPSIPMMRFPANPELADRWAKAIYRPDFVPTPYSHVCIKHFRDDQLDWNEYRRKREGTYDRTSRRYAKLHPDAVPCVFEVDPSTYRMRPCFRPKKPRPTQPMDQRECEILAGLKVEFKPEMWEDGSKSAEKVATTPTKRPRGRPRKHFTNSPKTDNNVTVKREVVSCCALACPNTSETHIMNCLPRDPAFRKIWVKNIDRLDWIPDEDSALCEIHFESEMWDHDMGEEKILKPDAVPSLCLHGEAIKSWVTMDNSGNVEKIVVEGQTATEDTNESSEIEKIQCSESEDEDCDVYIKGEALEPEIDMVEGSEDEMVSREASSSGEHFETIYCDSTFSDQEEESEDESQSNKENGEEISASADEENPLGPDALFSELRSASPVLQDGEVSCLENTSRKAQDDHSKAAQKLIGTKYYVISRALPEKDQNQRKIIKRRTGFQLGDEFQCPICDRRLSRRKNLEIHIQKLHPTSDLSFDRQQFKKRKVDSGELMEAIREVGKKKEAISSNKVNINQFKKPPPPLRPIVPQCLFSPNISSMPSIPVIPLSPQNSLVSTSLPPSSVIQTPPTGVLTSSIPIISLASQSPLVSSSVQSSTSAVITPTLQVHSQPLVTPTSIVTPSNLANSSASTMIATTTVVTTPRPLDPSPAGGEMKKQFLLLLPKPAVVPPKPLTTALEQPSSATDDSEMFTVNLSQIPLFKRLRLKEKLRELVDAVVKKNLKPEKIIIAYDRT